MRRALLAWGVPEVVRTDNGAAYVSKHICAVLKRLAVTHDVLPPFSPEKKPFIERALKTFAYDLVEGLPGYTGHSVAEAQAIRSRKTFAQRLFGRDEVATIGMSPAAFAQFCDRWCEAYNSREHGTLRTTPALRAAQHQGAVERIKDERALDLLLAPIGGWRQVSRTGIRIDGGSFLAPQLGDLVGERVECRIDEADAGRLYVFDGDGRFVCIAEDPERTGMSRQAVATAMRARAAKTLGEARRDQRATRKAAMPEPHEQRMIDIVEARLAAAPKVLAFPGRAEPSARAGVVEAGRAARAEEAPVARPRTEADAAAAAKLATLAEARRVEQARDPRAERAARIARGLAAWDALKAGAAIPETERAFFQGYEESPEFLGALAAARGVDIRRGHYRPLGKATAAAG
jgi:putative transposase